MFTRIQKMLDFRRSALHLQRWEEELPVDKNIIAALPIPGSKLLTAYHYGSSMWGLTAKLITEIPGDHRKQYMLQVVPNESPGRNMLEGEYESAKAMHAVVPSFIPVAHAWGPLNNGPGYFLLSEFREVGQQPPAPAKLTMRLAELHKNSLSPTGKFGFHVTTCHGRLPQEVG